MLYVLTRHRGSCLVECGRAPGRRLSVGRIKTKQKAYSRIEKNSRPTRSMILHEIPSEIPFGIFFVVVFNEFRVCARCVAGRWLVYYILNNTHTYIFDTLALTSERYSCRQRPVGLS